MEFLTKSRIATVLVVVAASSVLFAQNSVPDKLQDRGSIPDARRIIGQSVLAAERSLEARDRYTYVQRDQDRRHGHAGTVEIGKSRYYENDSGQRRTLRAACGTQRTASIARRTEKT